MDAVVAAPVVAVASWVLKVLLKPLINSIKKELIFVKLFILHMHMSLNMLNGIQHLHLACSASSVMMLVVYFCHDM